MKERGESEEKKNHSFRVKLLPFTDLTRLWQKIIRKTAVMAASTLSCPVSQKLWLEIYRERVQHLEVHTINSNFTDEETSRGKVQQKQLKD